MKKTSNVESDLFFPVITALQLQWPSCVCRTQEGWVPPSQSPQLAVPIALMASLPMVASFFYHFHHFIISILGQMSLLQHLLPLNLPPFPIPLFYFTYRQIKWSYVLLARLLPFSLGCKLHGSLSVKFTAKCLVSETVPKVAFQSYLLDEWI